MPPPHLIKQKALLTCARQFNLNVLVETGTFRGDMVEAMRNTFERIYSIELSQQFFEDARRRFKSAAHIELIRGDSGQELGRLLPKIHQPALFWLDGHYSAGQTARGEKITPIFEEMEHILGSAEKRHVVVVDDARCFGHHPGYPTLDELRQFILLRDPTREISIQDDSIRITPRGSVRMVSAG